MVEALVKNASDLRHVVERLFDCSPIGRPTMELLNAAKREGSELWAPIMVAWWLTEFFDLGSITKSLRIAVLGSEERDSALDGRLYQLVPWLVALPALEMEVELVGPKLKRASRSRRLDRFGFDAAPVSRTTCGKWWSKRPKDEPLPDLFVIFHPGMEGEARNWMQGEELPLLLRTGIPTAVFSYDQDEGERDAALFSEFGALVTSEVRSCPLAIRSSMSDMPGGAVFSGAAFEIKGFKERKIDDRRVQDIGQLSCAIREVYESRNYTERHSDAFRPCHIIRNGELCEVLRVFDRIYFDPVCEQIFIAVDGHELSGLGELKAPGLRETVRKVTSPLERACLGARIYHQLVSVG